MPGNRGGTGTPSWVAKIEECQRFSVPRSEVAQNVDSAEKRVVLGVDNPTYESSSFGPDFRLQTPTNLSDIPLTECTQPRSRPPSDSVTYERMSDLDDYPLGPEDGEWRLDPRHRKRTHVRPMNTPAYSDDGSMPKSRRKRVIIFVVIGIVIVVAAAAVALTLTLLKKGTTTGTSDTGTTTGTSDTGTTTGTSDTGTTTGTSSDTGTTTGTSDTGTTTGTSDTGTTTGTASDTGTTTGTSDTGTTTGTSSDTGTTTGTSDTGSTTETTSTTNTTAESTS